ncbi:MAG: tetratricopeptide repeat protein [Cyanobacteria bacterium SBLK]|nr:tetratricopeptide repeat protein [Cyanobacteria bacterium SBLK]
MQRKLVRILFVLGIVLAIAIAGIKPVHSLPTLNLHLLIAANPLERVKVKRSSWSSFQPARIGLMLRGNDRLLLPQNASATILCHNLQRRNPARGRDSSVSEVCGTISTTYDTEDILDPRARNDPKTPYLLYPRDTAIADSEPILRWNPVEGVQSYTVKVSGPGVKWEVESDRAEITYTGEPFQPGLRYWTVVTTDSGVSSTVEPRVFAGFTPLEETKVESLEAEAAKMQRQQLDTEAIALELAHLYWGSGLKGDAIRVLEEAIAEGSELVAVYRLLGRIYREVSLNRLAIAHWETGVELAEAVEDWDSLGDMQRGLAIAHRSLEQEDEARRWLEGARNAYLALGDEESLRQLEELAEKYF